MRYGWAVTSQLNLPSTWFMACHSTEEPAGGGAGRRERLRRSGPGIARRLSRMLRRPCPGWHGHRRYPMREPALRPLRRQSSRPRCVACPAAVGDPRWGDRAHGRCRSLSSPDGPDGARISLIGGWSDGTAIEVTARGTGACAGRLRGEASGVTSWPGEGHLVRPAAPVAPDTRGGRPERSRRSRAGHPRRMLTRRMCTRQGGGRHRRPSIAHIVLLRAVLWRFRCTVLS